MMYVITHVVCSTAGSADRTLQAYFLFVQKMELNPVTVDFVRPQNTWREDQVVWQPEVEGGTLNLQFELSVWTQLPP